MVFWWKESAEISKSVALNDAKFVIEGLLSNTAYHVMVLASGPHENVNSTSEVFYTAPNKVQGKCTEYFRNIETNVWLYFIYTCCPS